MKKKIFIGLAVIGLMMVIGSAGSADLDRISFGQAMLQSIIGMVCFAVGCIGGVLNA